MRRFLGLLLSVILIAGTLSFFAAPAAVAAPVEGVCNESTDVVFVGAAGSGQSQDQRAVGKEVAYMYEQLKGSLEAKGYRVVFKYVDYPASPVWTILLKTFYRSVNEGVVAAKAKLSQVVNECGSAKIIVGGYSQGAMIWHKALNQIYSPPETELYWKLNERLEGVLLLADGYAYPHGPEHFGTAGPDHTGIGNSALARSHGIQPQGQIIPMSRTATICNKSDVVCDFDGLLAVKLASCVLNSSGDLCRRAINSSIIRHTQYLLPQNRKGLDDAIAWVDARFLSKPVEAQPAIKSAKVEFVNRDFLLTFNISTPAYLSWNFESDSYGTAGYYFACYYEDGRLNEWGEPARWFASSGVIDRNNLRAGDFNDGQYVVDLERGIDPSYDIPESYCQINYASLWSRETGLSIHYGVQSPAMKTDPFKSVIRLAEGAGS